MGSNQVSKPRQHGFSDVVETRFGVGDQLAPAAAAPGLLEGDSVTLEQYVSLTLLHAGNPGRQIPVVMQGHALPVGMNAIDPNEIVSGAKPGGTIPPQAVLQPFGLGPFKIDAGNAPLL
jgi:hypothetical protein